MAEAFDGFAGVGDSLRAETIAGGVVVAVKQDKIPEPTSAVKPRKLEQPITLEPEGSEWVFAMDRVESSPGFPPFSHSLAISLYADLPFGWSKDVLWRLRQGEQGDSDESDLRTSYSYVNEKDVENFLARNPRLVKTLTDLAAFLAEKHNVTNISLEHIANDDYECDDLVIVPEFHTNDVKKLISLQGEILDDFFFPMDRSATDGLIFAF